MKYKQYKVLKPIDNTDYEVGFELISSGEHLTIMNKQNVWLTLKAEDVRSLIDSGYLEITTEEYKQEEYDK